MAILNHLFWGKYAVINGETIDLSAPLLVSAGRLSEQQGTLKILRR
jgi:hypothetical protein